MYLDLVPVEASYELRVTVTQVLNPNRRIDEHGDLLLRGRSPARRRSECPLAAAEGREAARALTRDERIETRVHDRRFLVDTAQLLRALEQFVVDDQGRPHMH
jgi:hypothetical protein